MSDSSVIIGQLTVEQYNALAERINPGRVREHDDGTPWIEGADVRRWLIRIFGYGGWGLETLDKRQLGEEKISVDDDETTTVWRVTREVTVRLTARTPDGTVLGPYDGTAAATVEHAVLGRAHNDATNTAETYAVKRAAANLGDLFGLGLRAGVLVHAYVGGSLVRPAGTVLAGAATVEPEPDCAPSDSDDTPTQPLTAAEGARLVAAASRRAAVTTRPVEDLAAELKASIVRARQARDAELALAPS